VTSSAATLMPSSFRACRASSLGQRHEASYKQGLKRPQGMGIRSRPCQPCVPTGGRWRSLGRDGPPSDQACYAARNTMHFQCLHKARSCSSKSGSEARIAGNSDALHTRRAACNEHDTLLHRDLSEVVCAATENASSSLPYADTEVQDYRGR
jgi:hypothetical protein